jgi:ankyrin repeat protein
MQSDVVHFFLAVQEGNPQKIADLVKENADLLNAWRDDPIATPLHACVFKPTIAKLLLELGADPNPIDSDDNMLTPLHVCSQAGDVETVKVLLSFEADPNARSKWGTALHHALGSNEEHFPQNYMDVVKILLEAEADPNAAIDPDSDQWTPLHQACSEGFANAVELLVERGARVFIGKDGLTPTRVAESMGFSEIAVFLTDRGAK